MTTYNPGTRVRLSATIKDAAGVLTDPDSLILYVKSHNGALQTFVYGTDNEVVKDSAGTYHADILVDRPDTWYARYQSLTPDGTEEMAFLVTTYFPELVD